jgi:ribosomal protein S18 acetylase RimI-like enzyme
MSPSAFGRLGASSRVCTARAVDARQQACYNGPALWENSLRFADSAGIAALKHPPSIQVTMIVRDFRMGDFDAVTDLWRRAGDGVHLGRSDTLKEIAKKVQRDPDLFVVAEEDGQLIGAVMGGFDGRRGMVYHLATDPSFRRQGVASTLMDALEQRLRAKGCVKAYLLVTNDNHEAQAYYLERGWADMTTALRIFGKEIS